jgi:RNA polymerase sigma-70 factor (ECF subfamily)
MRALMPRAWKDQDREGDEEHVEALLRRIGEGDRAARERLFEPYRPRLERMVRARLGKVSGRALADASDIVQKAMLVAIQRLDDYVDQRPMPVFPWLYVLTRDQIRKALAKEPRPVAIQIPEDSAERIADIIEDTGTTPSNAAMREELRRKVREAIAKLKPDYGEILMMRYTDGLKLTEIAVILGIGEGAARMRHLRAIEEMKRLLADLKPSA